MIFERFFSLWFIYLNLAKDFTIFLIETLYFDFCFDIFSSEDGDHTAVAFLWFFQEFNSNFVMSRKLESEINFFSKAKVVTINVKMIQKIFSFARFYIVNSWIFTWLFFVLVWISFRQYVFIVLWYLCTRFVIFFRKFNIILTRLCFERPFSRTFWLIHGKKSTFRKQLFIEWTFNTSQTSSYVINKNLNNS